MRLVTLAAACAVAVFLLGQVNIASHPRPPRPTPTATPTAAPSTAAPGDGGPGWIWNPAVPCSQTPDATHIACLPSVSMPRPGVSTAPSAR